MSEKELPKIKEEGEDEDGIEPEPLLPSDPSTAMLRCQGHYLVHLALYLGAEIFVSEDKGPYYCFQHDDAGKQIMKETDRYELNLTLWYLKYMHLVCFALVFFADNFYTPELNANVVAGQKLLYFFAIGLYLTVSIMAQLDYR